MQDMFQTQTRTQSSTRRRTLYKYTSLPTQSPRLINPPDYQALKTIFRIHAATTLPFSGKRPNNVVITYPLDREPCPQTPKANEKEKQYLLNTSEFTQHATNWRACQSRNASIIETAGARANAHVIFVGVQLFARLYLNGGRALQQ